MQRTKPISYGWLDIDPVMTSEAEDKYDFSTKHGQMYVVSGAVRKLQKIKEPKNKWTVLSHDTNVSYHTFTVEGKNLVVKSQYNDGEVKDTLKDTFSVSKWDNTIVWSKISHFLAANIIL